MYPAITLILVHDLLVPMTTNNSLNDRKNVLHLLTNSQILVLFTLPPNDVI